MTGAAVGFEKIAVLRANADLLDRFEGEDPGVTETVFHFGQILDGPILGQVTLIAGNIAMNGPLPCFILTLHDMTVDAHLGAVRKIGVSLGIPESEETDPCRYGQEDQGESGDAELHHFAGIARMAAISACRARSTASPSMRTDSCGL